jgi:hypothetical protein
VPLSPQRRYWLLHLGHSTTVDAVLVPAAFLLRMLIVDAATYIDTGVLLSPFATPLSAFLGIPAVLLLYACASLFPIATFMAWLALRRNDSRLRTWLVILGNAGLVAGSVLVLVLFSPTAVGHAFVIALALVVAFLPELEYYGLRRIAS